jgi:hypothetical protein
MPAASRSAPLAQAAALMHAQVSRNAGWLRKFFFLHADSIFRRGAERIAVMAEPPHTLKLLGR